MRQTVLGLLLLWVLLMVGLIVVAWREWRARRRAATTRLDALRGLTDDDDQEGA